MKLYFYGSREEPCCFARKEFKNYVNRMFTDVEAVEEGADLYIGMPKPEDAGLVLCDPDVDEIYIDVQAGKGMILGSNPGAVLIGVYRFFKECGARFLRPGKFGEYIPKRLMSNVKVQVKERASYEVRNIVIEGACSYESVYNIADFGPKVGLNGYFMQFIDSFVFFERWYDHHGNPKMEAEHLTKERAKEYQVSLMKEFKKRGMRTTGMGHGWTCLPVGLSGSGWDVMTEEVPPETMDLLAMVKGERKLNGGKPMDTNLCYSNPVVQEKIVEFTVQYAKEHPHTDKVIFVFADAMNVCCECENCKGRRLSDMMVLILNKIDERLTAEGLPLHIIFPIYLDTLWEPVEYKLQNPDRFSMTFCPINRYYNVSYPTEGFVKPGPHRFNKCERPRRIEENMGFLEAWRTRFQGLGYAGEYHYMWAHYADLGYQKIAEVIHDDIQKLGDLTLSGMESYQPQRCVVPTGMSLYNYGATLWNKDVPFEKISEDYFRYAFGEGWEECQAYLQALSDTFDMRLRYEGRDYTKEDCIPYFEACLSKVKAFKAAYANREKRADETQELSWKYLELYNEYLERYLPALLTGIRDAEKGKALLNQAFDWLCEQERDDEMVQQGWDIYLLTDTLGRFYDTFMAGTVEEHM